MNSELLLYVCIGGAAAAIIFVIVRVIMGGDADVKLRERLAKKKSIKSEVDNEAKPTGSDASLMQRISNVAAEPFMPKSRERQSGLKRDLGYAGFHTAPVLRMVQGFKLICLVCGLILGLTVGFFANNILLGFSLGGLLGYFLPKMWLRLKIKGNQKSLNLGLPDALDLMVVCVEAGLTIDAAMQRVGQELVLAHPAVSRELGIAHMETRVGLSRSESLKNLGIRTGNASVQSLAAMLIQADRFGTSIANALRIHADSMRTKRQHAAEEMAAKASVKMSFPLVLFIFPATFIVLAGPTVIGL
ncbi:MAG TPA: type II secretion system F family protein, partial [Tepidisphaeraceae bacterium]|nr:type II secretion system F family protein [Tepidisphaeraceae bacterium]